MLQFKRRLCNVEGIRDFASSTLYPSASNQFPMDDGDRVPDALGSTLDNPMELVIISKYPMRHRIGNAYPQPQYSTRSPFVIPLAEISWFYCSLLFPLHRRWSHWAEAGFQNLWQWFPVHRSHRQELVTATTWPRCCNTMYCIRWRIFTLRLASTFRQHWQWITHRRPECLGYAAW